MNLHEIEAMKTPGFMVHASNIHTDETETYGPFPGSPLFTYDFMRCSGEENVPDDDHIFSYSDNGDSTRGEWFDQEGAVRYDGWRRCYYRPIDARRGNFGIEHGPFWTDLFIEFLPDVTAPWESNLYPED